MGSVRRGSARRSVKLLTVAGAMLLAVALFEAFVKISGVDYNISPNWKYHRVLGWSQVPNARFNYDVGGPVHVEFNSLGFRDVEHAVEKPAGRRRIVVIGDSFCEALQVNLEETFFSRLQARLSARGGAEWEVINLGVGDFGNAQELIALERYGALYQPDIVIQEIFPLNDVCNDSIELAGACKSDNDRYRPYFVAAGGELALTSAEPVRNFLRRHLASYGLVERALLASRKGELAAEYDAAVERLGMEPAGPLLGVYLPPPRQHPRVARAWTEAEAVLAKTAKWCREHGITYLPFVIPFENVVGEPAPPLLEAFPGLVPDYPDQRLGRLFDALGTPVVPVKPDFDRRAGEVLPYIDGHLNRAGHAVVADALYARIVALGL